jgi:hypothetical protein
MNITPPSIPTIQTERGGAVDEEKPQLVGVKKMTKGAVAVRQTGGEELELILSLTWL